MGRYDDIRREAFSVDLRYEDVCLLLETVSPADPHPGFPTTLTLGIVSEDGRTRYGAIRLRFGDTETIRMRSGHVGFHIHPPHRGHAYARKGCLALRPFLRRYLDELILTCEADNIPSIRIFEALGAVPSPASAGSTIRHYTWDFRLPPLHSPQNGAPP